MPYTLPRPNVGDYVLIKSKNWYDDNKNDDGTITFGPTQYSFSHLMSRYCGRWCKIACVKTDFDEPNGWYCVIDDASYAFTENMIDDIKQAY